MNLSIIGTGYVGLTTGACLAQLGHTVICVDIDKNKIAQLKKGKIPIFEPGLAEIVKENLKNRRLSFSTDTAAAIAQSEIVFSAVGTPPGKDHQADLKYVKIVAKAFGQAIEKPKIFINKSTVPVGTAKVCKKIIKAELQKRGKKIEFSVVSNPEFLREGSAVKDTLKPDRIIVGTQDASPKKLLQKLFAPYAKNLVPILFTDLETAEIIKYASNAFLATKISFINEIANFCEKAGGDVNKIADGMGLDHRIGREFLNAGIGYGGSCFPKDVKALIQTGKKHGYDFRIIKATEQVNNSQKLSLFRNLKNLIPNLKNKTIAIWGLAFKPGTDDMREAPSIHIIKALLKEGALVRAYDPAATENAKKIFAKKISYTKTPESAAKNADALLLVTEWPEFQKAKTNALKKNAPVLDGRHFLSS